MSQHYSPTSITFGCPSCQGQLTIPSNAGPLKGPCPLCGQTISIRSESPPPAPAVPSVQAMAPPPPPAQAASVSQTSEPQPITTTPQPIAAPLQQQAAVASQTPLAPEPEPALNPWTALEELSEDLPDDSVFDAEPAQSQRQQSVLPPQQTAEPPSPAELISPGPVVNRPGNQALFCQCNSCGSNQPFEIAQMGTFLPCDVCRFPIQLPGQQQDTANDHIPDEQLSPEETYQRTLEALQQDDSNNRSRPESERLWLLEEFFALSLQLRNLAKPEAQSATSGSPYTIEQGVASDVPVGNRLAEYQSGQTVDQFKRPMRIPTTPDFTNSGSREEFSFEKAPPIESAKLLKKKRRKQFPDIEQNKAANRREPAPTNTVEKVSLIVLVLAVIGASVWAGMHLLRKTKQPAAMTEPETLASGQVIAPPPITRGEQAMIEETIRGFHQATSVESKAAYVLEGELMHDKLREYYRRKPVEPLVARISKTLETSNIEDARYLRAQGTYENGRAFEILVLRQGDQFLIDWNAYVGYSQMDWMEFLLEQPTTPTLFRLIAEPVEFYEFGYDDSIRYLCLKATGANETQECYAYVDRTSPAGVTLRRMFASGGMDPQRITVQLAFEQKGLGKNQALITEFISGSWATPPIKTQAH